MFTAPKTGRLCQVKRLSAASSSIDSVSVPAASLAVKAPPERLCEPHAGAYCCTLCCTLGLAVRILLLTSGANGTRTTDPLLANNRQHVHPRPSPQVTVLRRIPESAQIRACCGTFLLYSPPRSTALQGASR
jgi:hypothetical protein